MSSSFPPNYSSSLDGFQGCLWEDNDYDWKVLRGRDLILGHTPQFFTLSESSVSFRNRVEDRVPIYELFTIDRNRYLPVNFRKFLCVSYVPKIPEHVSLRAPRSSMVHPDSGHTEFNE